MTPIVRDTIRLRYRLLPYLYTQYWRAHLGQHGVVDLWRRFGGDADADDLAQDVQHLQIVP